MPLEASASSVRNLTAQQLAETPGFQLDDKLRQVAGFQLFRRTSSWVANPTTQGTSLRGLGSTAVSRTLVLSDQVPLNDAFGGWIHWNEAPTLAIANVEVVRGGASDLYGSSAIGGVVDVVPVVPSQRTFAADLSGATEDTASLSALASDVLARTPILAAATIFHSDGYTLVAPALRGPIDTSSTLHSQSGRLEANTALWSAATAFLRGNLLNEARNNGTPFQTNATRLWRYATGIDGTRGTSSRYLVRVYGNDQAYRQSFSSIATNRASEQLTRLQRSPSQQLGASAQWATTIHHLTVVAGADILDTRGRDDEIPVTRGIEQSLVTISARQRETGGYAELLWQPQSTSPLASGWSLALSGRIDRFRSFDAHQTSSVPLPETDETLLNPRLGVVRQLGHDLSLTGSVFRAFRGPSLNELYRTGQVGQQTTLANPSLHSERATGYELGGLVTPHHLGSVRTAYFWTQVNRPVAAVTLSTTATSSLLQRQNLGQLESRGLTAEWDLHPLPWVTVTGGYQYALSTVTRYQVDPTLVGKWTPQVPRNAATLQLRLERRHWAILTLNETVNGRQYDDSANVYQLHGYAQLNAELIHPIREHWQLYVSTQNLLDRAVDAGKTPVLTLGTPRTVQSGIRLHY